MTAVANPPSFLQQINNRSQWGNNSPVGLTPKMSEDNSRRNNSMFAPRKSAQRSNSSSSIASISSNSSTSSTSSVASNATATHSNPQVLADTAWSSSATRKKPARNGLYLAAKSEPISAVSTARPQSILTTNGASGTSTFQPSVLPSQHLQNGTQQQNARAGAATAPEGNPVVLSLLSMNGTFERKNITVPFYPDCIRIGRQTNAKTLPTPTNGYFDSKVLSRQHAEIWADRAGKVYIRDVKSSNGTFVNGTRLSPENRDSLPHEIQAMDSLELGIDIVSEDQKTVVHHKVAAKVEHAGFLGATTNVLDMSFGDLDPANGMGSSQGEMQMRGRSTSQGTVGSSGRMGFAGNPAGNNMNMMVQHQRPMNFWLTPVTTEQIVKKLTQEMKLARMQTNDLNRTGEFFDTLLSKPDLRDFNKINNVEPPKQPHMNGSLSSKPRFSDPPAPPPQQPLPEKPDMARTNPHDFNTPSLKRSSTERPRSITNGSPIRQEQTSQVLNLVEALASARKEIDHQSARMRDLESMLQKEREARETAEELAKRLEQASAKTNGFALGGHKGLQISSGTRGSILEDAFDPPVELEDVPESIGIAVTKDSASTAESVEASTSSLQQRLDLMVAEMNEMKQHMESYKRRAEVAEAERDADRLSLAEMIQKARADESKEVARRSSRGRSRSRTVTSRSNSSGEFSHDERKDSSFAPLLQKTSAKTEKGSLSLENGELSKTTLASSRTGPGGNGGQMVHHATPYVSMLGVVGFGLLLMAYMNGWQKAER